MDLTIYTAHDCFHYQIRSECAISKGLVLVSLVNNRVSIEEVCLPSFEVFNCLMNLVTSCCLDNENEPPLKLIVWFSTWRISLQSIPSRVIHSLVRCILVHGPTKSLRCRSYTHMWFWVSLFNIGS